MKNAVIFVVLGAGAMVGFLSPPPGDSMNSIASTGDASVSAAQRAEAQLAVAQNQFMGGDVSLERNADGHFYADVTVDGTTVNMLVDTGASVIALTGEDAEAMGLYWDSATVRPVAQGASGPVYGVPVTLERVSVGQLEVGNVEAVVVPEGLGVSLLGQSFLSKIERVEMDQHAMHLGS